MHYTIESQALRIQINLKGMELSSIQSKASGHEFLWQGDPQFWTGQAPILFPIIGALKGGKTSYRGKDYALPKHGFVRNSALPRLMRAEENLATFCIESDAETLEIYPFDFRFEVSFRLSGNSLEVSHQVFNTGDRELYYSLGGHPAFNCPLFPGEKLEDYQIEFPKNETDSTWMITSEGLIGEKGEMILKDTKEIPLHAHLFDHDALIFKNLKSRNVFLSHRQRGPAVKMEFGDFDYLGIWAKPGAPFVCLEPWLGIADSVHHSGELAKKEGIRALEPGKSETKSYRIEIL